MEDWETSLPVVLDTIKVTVKAFAEGKVEFEPVPEKTRTGYIRQAPEFATGCGEHLLHIYTAATLGEFLGWLDADGHASKRLLHGLNALELIELDCMQALHVAAATGQHASPTAGSIATCGNSLESGLFPHEGTLPRLTP